VAELDIREVAAAEPAPVAEDVVRVPSADETDRAIEQASRALAEIRARDVIDAEEAEQHRAAQLNSFHTHDQAADGQEYLDESVSYERADTP